MRSKYNKILASKSPRRAEILNMIGIDFKVIPSNIKEDFNNDIMPQKIAEELSLEKAKKISTEYPADIIIGADTLVVSNGQIFGKPKNKVESRLMLKALSDSSHKVITGITLINENIGAIKTFNDTTEVFVSKISNSDVDYYIENFNTFDKSGGYGIQEWFSVWIKKINGCYYNVMGLPVSKFYKHLLEFEKLMN